MAKVQSSQKKRLPNFSNLEKIKLIEIIERERSIIENKKTDNVSLKDKENCWINIAKEFNSNSISGHRDVGCLKNCWDNLKKKTRKHFADIRSELFKTGGGKMNIIDDPIAERVKGIIQPSVEGLPNKFDSDYMPGIDEPQSNEQLDDKDVYQVVEILEEEDSNAANWAQWTPVKLSSEKSKELQFSNNNKNEDLLTLKDIQTVLPQSSKEKSNSSTSSASGSNLKRKKSKQLQVNASKRNERYYNLAQSKLELVETMKENLCEKTAIEIAICKMQLEKERLQVELLKKQLDSFEKKQLNSVEKK
ncbi:uncharacterized protein LOC143893960 [Temnothorax americanus]|uniref:uncharacterized protein LOC143893960 n=1 Tax=Temnothorax americanus TaxID=1964332 RepID=UPI0040697534